MVTAAVLGLLVVVTVVTRLHTYGEPLERDLATYAVIAHELSDGRRLYSDLWDHKPPATHLTYAAAQTLAGVGPGSVYLLGVLTALATLLGVFWAGGTRRPGAVTGLWAAAFWTVAAGDLTLQANQPNTEVFLNACLIWAFALLAGMHGGRGDRARVTAVALLLALATLY
jgi:4-amino-4-deoxy-L-arabinose transferase-like glycosyltransferase